MDYSPCDLLFKLEGGRLFFITIGVRLDHLAACHRAQEWIIMEKAVVLYVKLHFLQIELPWA